MFYVRVFSVLIEKSRRKENDTERLYEDWQSFRRDSALNFPRFSEIIITIMRIGQKCSRLKTLFQFILTAAVLHITAHTTLPQTDVQKSFEPNLPLQRCWDLAGGNFNGDKVASDNDSVFFSTIDGKLLSLNARTGFENWNTDFGGSLDALPEISESGSAVFIVSKTASGNNIAVRRLDGKTGVAVWLTALNIEQPDKNKKKNEKKNEKKSEKKDEGKEENVNKVYPFAFNDKLLLITSAGDFYRLNSADGKLEAEKSFQIPFSSAPFFENEHLIYVGAAKSIYALTLDDSKSIAEYKTSDRPTALVKSGGRLFWGDEHGTVNSINVSSGLTANPTGGWKIRTGGAILSLQTIGKILIAASLDNYIYALSTGSGKLLWKKRLSNRPAFSSTVGENYLAFTSVGDSSVIFVETKTGKTVNKINLPENIYFTGAPLIAAATVILPTDRGFFAFTSAKKCGE